MKATGIVRKMDELGRVVIPKETRRTLNIHEKEPLEIFIEGETIILQKYQSYGTCPITGEISPPILLIPLLCIVLILPSAVSLLLGSTSAFHPLV